MKKLLVVILIISISFLSNYFFTKASTETVVFDKDVVVNNITYSTTTTNLLIYDGSTSQEVSLIGGVLTITKPGLTFKIGSNDSAVKAIKASDSQSTDVACAENTTPGVSYLLLPDASSSPFWDYTITPLNISDCNSLCPTLNNVMTYNDFPVCGAANCVSGYSTSGTASSSICTKDAPPSGGGSSGGSTINYCSYVTYADWGECVDGIKSRLISTRSPSNCSLTPKQENNKTQECILNLEDSEEDNSIDNENGNITDNSNIETSVTKDRVLIILKEAKLIFKESTKKITELLKIKRDLNKEFVNYGKYVKKIIGDSEASKNIEYSINNFITYGTETTFTLGTGERAGVINSFKSAFKRLPTTEQDWSDIIKIANGRWPSQRSKEKESGAEKSFIKVYLRKPDRKNPHDDAAVTVITYGLRPSDRNLDSEKAAIRIFENIFRKKPVTASGWDIVRAIAYSGAIR